MSTSPEPAYTPRPEPSSSNLWLSVAGILGSFLIFGFVLVVAYVPSRKETVSVDPQSVDESDRWKLDPHQRREKLLEAQRNAETDATTYAWIDKSANSVRLPINRAMELVVQEHGAKK